MGSVLADGRHPGWRSSSAARGGWERGPFGLHCLDHQEVFELHLAVWRTRGARNAPAVSTAQSESPRSRPRAGVQAIARLVLGGLRHPSRATSVQIYWSLRHEPATM